MPTFIVKRGSGGRQNGQSQGCILIEKPTKRFRYVGYHFYFIFLNSVQGVGGTAAGRGIGGAPYKKNGGKKIKN